MLEPIILPSFPAHTPSCPHVHTHTHIPAHACTHMLPSTHDKTETAAGPAPTLSPPASKTEAKPLPAFASQICSLMHFLRTEPTRPLAPLGGGNPQIETSLCTGRDRERKGPLLFSFNSKCSQAGFLTNPVQTATEPTAALVLGTNVETKSPEVESYPGLCRDC